MVVLFGSQGKPCPALFPVACYMVVLVSVYFKSHAFVPLYGVRWHFSGYSLIASVVLSYHILEE